MVQFLIFRFILIFISIVSLYHQEHSLMYNSVSWAISLDSWVIYRINVSEYRFSDWLIAKHFLPNVFAFWSRCRIRGIESCRMVKLRKAVAECPTLGDGYSCKQDNPNECVTDQHTNCYAYAECKDPRWGYKCKCFKSYIGDGVNCKADNYITPAPVDPCVAANCWPYATCITVSNIRTLISEPKSKRHTLLCANQWACVTLWRAPPIMCPLFKTYGTGGYIK